MKTVLLTRCSAFQYYCANRLYQRGALDHVIFESGSSVSRSRVFEPGKLVNYIDTVWTELRRSPFRTAQRVINRLHQSRYYGNQDHHHQRILRSDYESVVEGLETAHFSTVNEPEAIEHIAHLDPDLVYVFGTGMIRRELISRVKCPIVNMHWGLSPYFRGEGIVSALALGEVSDVGVTTHILAEGVDSGPILFKDRLDHVDSEDNFYSLGLRLTMMGVERFAECHDRVRRGEQLTGAKQDLSLGKLYSGKVMRERPGLFPKAWRNLKRAAR